METDLNFKSIPELRMMAFRRGLNLDGVVSQEDLVKLLIRPSKIARRPASPPSRKTVRPRTWRGELLTTNYPGTPLPPSPDETIYPDLPPLSTPNLNLVCGQRSQLASYFDRPGDEPFPCVPEVVEEAPQVEESAYPKLSSPSIGRKLYQPPNLTLVPYIRTHYRDRLSLN